MHATTSEPWTRRQLRASAWLWQYAEREYGIPCQNARITGAGYGYVKVLRKGHASHQRVSSAAGFNDRSDPGPLYDWTYVRRAAEHYKKHASFEGF
jgi:N-acetyl-anhydromuramyl-L-alanine amidase AmpD